MRIVTKLLSTLSLLLSLASCATTNLTEPKTTQNQPNSKTLLTNTIPAGYQTSGQTYKGKASFYAIKCNGGTATASGERLRDNAMTAAHKTLPMGTKVLVTNKANGKQITVRINDRGPYIKGRIIDLTIGAAKEIGMVSSGVVPCEVQVLEKVQTSPAPPTSLNNS